MVNRTARKIRVLIVDDSAVIRSVLRDGIGQCPDLEVAGQAADGRQALELLESVGPDVVTLDVQMPHMDGLSTLDAILARHPLPVIMVSSLTQQGASTTLEALDRGAMDYVGKPERSSETQILLREELPRKIRSVAGCDVRRILQIRQQRARKLAQAGAADFSRAKAPPSAADEAPTRCIVIGISTGGPPALGSMFEALAPPLPPIVVVQHMPAQFTRSLAWRLNASSRLTIKEAESGDVLHANQVLLAPGGRHLRVQRRGSQVRAIVEDGPPVSGHRPSIDVLMGSVAEAFGPRCLGVIMTGMGRDGVDGCRALRAVGGYVLGQDEASSDVYGMNKAAYVEGHVDQQFHLDEAPLVLTRQVSRLG